MRVTPFIFAFPTIADILTINLVVPPLRIFELKRSTVLAKVLPVMESVVRAEYCRHIFFYFQLVILSHVLKFCRFPFNVQRVFSLGNSVIKGRVDPKIIISHEHICTLRNKVASLKNYRNFFFCEREAFVSLIFRLFASQSSDCCLPVSGLSQSAD